MKTILLIMAIIAMFLIILYFMKRIDLFLGECVKSEDSTIVNLIHLGFDTPALSENFICRMHDANKSKKPMEFLVYSGAKDDMMNMLLAGNLDFLILTQPIYEWGKQQVEHKELVLQPNRLRATYADIYIESASKESMKVIVYWIPERIGYEKVYFTNLLMELV